MADNSVHRLDLGFLTIQPIPVDDPARILFVDREEGDSETGEVVEEVRAERGLDLKIGEIGFDDGASGRDLRPGDRECPARNRVNPNDRVR